MIEAEAAERQQIEKQLTKKAADLRQQYRNGLRDLLSTLKMARMKVNNLDEIAREAEMLR